MRRSAAVKLLLPRLLCALCCLWAAPSAGAQEWAGFEWVRVNYSGRTYDKAALYLPVRLEGVGGTYYMQLDTGLSLTVLYEVPYAQALREGGALGAERLGRATSNKDYAAVRFGGRVGNLALSGETFLVRKGYGAAFGPGERRPKIGSIGLDLFAERVLLLDFRKRRFAVMGKGESVPAGLERRATFFDVSLRGGKLFIPVSHGGERVTDVFYDTGSSAFNVFGRDVWHGLTGRTGDEADNERVSVMAWGREVVLVGAKTLEPLFVGPLDFGRGMVYFRLSGAENLAFEKYPFKVNGLVGNSPFYEEHTVILDLPRKRMGVLRGGKAGGD